MIDWTQNTKLVRNQSELLTAEKTGRGSLLNQMFCFPIDPFGQGTELNCHSASKLNRIKQKFCFAEDFCSLGVEEFKKGNFKNARDYFSKAIDKVNSESSVNSSTLSSLYNDRAGCYLKLGKIKKAKEDASKSISCNEKGYEVSAERNSEYIENKD